MILVDASEPDDIINLLRQTAPVEVLPLNNTGRSDYYFGGDDGKTRQFGRVQAGELLSNIDSMEDELRRYYDSADENNQIIEGIISDVPLTRKDKSLEAISVRFKDRPTTLFAYRVAASGFIFSEHAYSVSADLLYAWLFRLYDAGIQTFHTINYVSTARLISAIYKNCQRPPEEHDTLNRYYIPRISLSEKQPDSRKRISIREQNPFIRALMGLSLIYHLDIGEKKATALYKAGYKTLLDIAYATEKELTSVPGIGKTIARGLLNAIGVEEEL